MGYDGDIENDHLGLTCLTNGECTCCVKMMMVVVYIFQTHFPFKRYSGAKKLPKSCFEDQRRVAVAWVRFAQTFFIRHGSFHEKWPAERLGDGNGNPKIPS